MLKWRALGGPGQENRGLEGLGELLNSVPFQEYECAMWALRIERRKLAAVHTLDLFGLATYPTEAHQRSGLPLAGKLAFSVHGHDELDIDLLDLLGAAKRWWAQFRGHTLRGRPKGTGAWATREHFVADLERAVITSRSDGVKVGQENVALRPRTRRTKRKDCYMEQGSFAERLRVLRARRGMPLTVAAERVGVDRHTLRNLELGESTPRYPTLLKLSEAYGVPVEELLEEEPVPLAGAVGKVRPRRKRGSRKKGGRPTT
jgi:DNA-binding XRE family transcriptional regulator